MKFRAAVIGIVMAVAASGFASDRDAASSKDASGFHVASAVWVYDAPAAPSASVNVPASPLAVSPIAPSVATRTERGFLPRLRGAVVPDRVSPREQKAWMALSLASHGTAAFDAYSTRASIASGRGYERDPLMKPFANSGLIYPAAQVVPFGLDYLSRRMMRSNNTVLRHTWFLPQLASTVGSAWVGVRNLHVAN